MMRSLFATNVSKSRQRRLSLTYFRWFMFRCFIHFQALATIFGNERVDNLAPAKATPSEKYLPLFFPLATGPFAKGFELIDRPEAVG
jgi:hypothetical protein